MIASNYLHRPEALRHRWVASLLAATVLVVAVGGAPFVVRDVVRTLSLQFTALPNLGTVAPFVFLIVILAISRIATHGPLVLIDDRSLVRRWLTDGVWFAFAMAALLLCVVVLNWHDGSSVPDFLWLRLREVVIPSLTEEIAFRGFLTVAVSAALRAVAGGERRSDALSVVVASAAFAFAHQPSAVEPSTGLAIRFTAGLTFGLLTLRSRSLVPAMLAHAAINTELLRC